MALFVNREKELDDIGDAVQALLNNRPLLRPIIEIRGVRGMGKTALLKQVEQYCLRNNLTCISIDIGHASANLEHDLITQIARHLQDQSSVTGQSVVSAAQTLLRQGPAMMLFDAVDAASPEQLDVLQLVLRELIDNEKLCVVLASKKTLSFLQRERRLAQKQPNSFSLEALPREHCEHFLLASVASPIDAEVRNLILEWSKGYPLVMAVMVEATNNGLDPRTEQGKAEILTRLKNQVIYQEILGDVEPQKRSYYYSILELFSIPRRCSLVIMQDLIEKFSPELRRDEDLAYLSLPKDISEATSVMRWNMVRAGYTIDTPVRELFLLLLKQEQLEHYLDIHTFLAQKNRELAQKVSGSERVRYLREYLYHLVNSQTPSEQSLIEAVEMAGQETPEVFVQFTEEFAQDHDLKETLGQQLPVVEAAVRSYQEKMHLDREGEV